MKCYLKKLVILIAIWNDEYRRSRTPTLTQEDVKRLIAEALENFSVKTQV